MRPGSAADIPISTSTRQKNLWDRSGLGNSKDLESSDGGQAGRASLERSLSIME